MTKQLHVVSTDALGTIGTLIDESAGRDAIHLAVEPAVAAETLYPGQRVGFVNGGVGKSKNEVGIVDPFLAGAVHPGQHFWLVVFPRTITSLRHVWEHPAFSPANEQPEPVISDKEESERWMRRWATEHMSEDYYGDYGSKRSEEDAYRSAIHAGEENHIGPYESARDYIDDEWWDHWEAITGKSGKRDDYFSCAC